MLAYLALHDKVVGVNLGWKLGAGSWKLQVGSWEWKLDAGFQGVRDT
jgi:hypothetical protein